MDNPLTDPAGLRLARLNATGMPDLCFSGNDEAVGVWTLRQGDAVVGVLKLTPPPTLLAVADGTWTGSRQTGIRGWRAEFTRDGIGAETLSYHPRLIPGGEFRL